MSDMPPPPSVPPPPPSSALPPQQPGGAVAPLLGKRRSLGLTILLTIITFGIWALVWAYKNGDELKRWSGTGLGGVAYLLITLFISPVTMFVLANEVENLYQREGRQPPITTLWGLWFLLPLIGPIIWYVRIQKSLNDYWTLHGQTNNPGV